MKKWARHLHSLWTGIRKKEIQLPMWKQTALDANQHATISSFPHKLPKHTPPTFKYIFMLRIYPYSYFIMSILPLIFLPLPSNRVAFLINKRPCFGNSLGWSFIGLINVAWKLIWGSGSNSILIIPQHFPSSALKFLFEKKKKHKSSQG